VEYRSTLLEKNYRYELLTEDSSMVKIDLIDPMAYHFNPHEKIPVWTYWMFAGRRLLDPLSHLDSAEPEG